MKKYYLIEATDGKKKTQFVGTEKELVDHWNDEKLLYTSWIFENLYGHEPYYEELKMASLTEVEDLGDLIEVLEVLDHGWWTLAVEERNLKDYLKTENLYNVYYDIGKRTDELKFIVGDVEIWVMELEKDENVEDYWEIQKNIDKAIKELTDENIDIKLIKND